MKMFRIRRKRATSLVQWMALGLLPLGLLGNTCGKGGGGDDREELPVDAFQYSDEAWPAHATRIESKEEFDRLVKEGKLLPTSVDEIGDQFANELIREADNDAVIERFMKEHPRAGDPRPMPIDPQDPAIEIQGDGSVKTTVKLANGVEKSILNMSYRHQKAALADSIRQFPTRSNQVLTYRTLWELMSEEHRKQYGMIEPDLLEQYPQRYPTEEIIAMNEHLVQITVDPQYAERPIEWELNPQPFPTYTFDPDPKPAGYPASCAQEIGASGTSDRAGNNDACQPSANGIFKNYVWKNKWYHTCVKDQSNRGTCVAFANTALMEYWVAKKSKKWVNLSEQGLYNKMKFNWDRWDYGDGYGCERGFEKMKAENWLQYFENQWPYNPSRFRDGIFQKGPDNIMGTDDDVLVGYEDSCDGYTDTCSDTTHQSQMFCVDLGWFRYCGYSVPEKNPDFWGYRMTTYAQLYDAANKDFSVALVALASLLGSPVAIEIPVTPAWDSVGGNGFMSYVAGQTNRGGHAVTVTGYVSNEALKKAYQAKGLADPPVASGGGYFVVKNSWGNCWADAGYIYVPWNFLRDYMYAATILHGVQGL